MLDVEKINVCYGNIQVLWDISLKINKNEIVTVIGSNGAGKTTLLKTILGLLYPISGNIRFLHEKIDGKPPHYIVRKGITLIPERGELFTECTVLENLILGAQSKSAKEKLNDSIELVYNLFPILKEKRKQLAYTLSGGEQRMLSIARGLISRPKLIMLDEISSGLAPIVVAKVFDIVKKLRELGVTVLLIEQNIYYGLEIADRGYVMEAGKMVLEGKAQELLNNEYVKKAYLGR